MRPAAAWPVLLIAAGVLAPPSNAAPPLPRFNVDPTQTSVSGLSAGGFMAVQFEVIHSSTIKGAGIIAGGPYFCARGDVTTATTVCSCTHPFLACRVRPAGTDVPGLIAVTDRNATNGAIDPTTNLAAHKVYLFSGQVDTKVPTPVVDDLERYYRNYLSGTNIRYVKTLPPPARANHAMPTETFGNACDTSVTPFINDCDFDAAGGLLSWIYGGLNPRNTSTLSGRFIEFDQKEFLANPRSHGLAESGFGYVPAACANNEPCKLHVVFHGCQQDPTRIQDKYYRNTGYNPWADTNKLIVLYPQLAPSSPGNPNGCWDWWGYDDPNYATKTGRQVAAVKAMIDRITGSAPPPPPPPPSACFTASNVGHLSAGRAHGWWFVYANGSNDPMGTIFSFRSTTLKRTGADFYEVVEACP